MSRALIAGFIASLVGFVNGVAICQAGGISLNFNVEHVDKTNAFLPAEKSRLIEAIRDDQTETTQASIKTWAEGHQTVHSVARTLGTNLLLQDTLKEVFAKGLQMGRGEHDLAALVEVFQSKRGLKPLLGRSASVLDCNNRSPIGFSAPGGILLRVLHFFRSATYFCFRFPVLFDEKMRNSAVRSPLCLQCGLTMAIWRIFIFVGSRIVRRVVDVS